MPSRARTAAKTARTRGPKAPKRRSSPTTVKTTALGRITRERDEALEQQAATAEILKVISQSAFDLSAVLRALVSSAVRLCEADTGIVRRREGDTYPVAATFGFTEKEIDYFARYSAKPDRGSVFGRAILESRSIHVPDLLADRDINPDRLKDYSKVVTIRTGLGVPLLREGKTIGVFTLQRWKRRPFTKKQIALAETFANQAVIAIENTRLINETREALERQTATADILKVIASSPNDVQPVFDAIAERSNRLIDGFSSAVFRFVDGAVHLAAITSVDPAGDEAVRASYPRPIGGYFAVPQAGEVLAVTDTEDYPDARLKSVGRMRRFRSIVYVPLKSAGTSIGTIGVGRKEPGPFAAHHIDLLQTFADQAVIAIENVRMFNEVQARTRDLEESLQQQTATADVLKVISRSAFDLDSVLSTLVASAAQLCEAERGLIFLRDGDFFHTSANFGFSPELEAFARANPLPADGKSTTARAGASGLPVQAVDLLADETQGYLAREYQRIGGHRTNLGVPLRRDGKTVGVFTLTRQVVKAFTPRQIELVQTFADQAVIAIENVRLFEEVQVRTRDLQESLQRQTATADVLQVISASPGDLVPIFDKMLESAIRVCGAEFGSMTLTVDGGMQPTATYNVPAEYAAARGNRVFVPHPTSPLATAMGTRQVVQWADLRTTESYLERYPAAIELVELGGARTVAIVPMLRDDDAIGAITIYRKEVQLFGDKQIELLNNFAKQAVIAIENARLLRELRQRTDDLSKSLDDLRAAQDRLVQTEKLASLGQLTAGIAHEIKNPLNFVNNFSALSAELTEELNDVLKPVALDGRVRREVDELTGLLKENLEKVVQHGKRADSIVKNMLLHSREGSGERRSADINALVDESLNLAYHGARAEKSGFNITLQRDFDADAGSLEVFPQEITRALLNLISNGFYAAARRLKENGEQGFEPVLSAATKSLGSTVEIRIRDNGNGIPPDVKEKMFNPFFTTKPAGEGTGLGLSMTHDIIVKQHGGRIDVLTESGHFAEFVIVLPRSGPRQ